jgi:hypothetical protein
MNTMNTPEDTLEALIATFMHRFVNRAQPYAVQEADGSYRWRYDDLTPVLLAAHLRGEVTLALSSSDEAGRCRWLCLDVDASDGLPQLLQVRAALEALGVSGMVEASRRGGHLWLFVETPVAVGVARTALQRVLDTVIPERVAVPTMELYPDVPASPNALGHAVRLPLGMHRLTGRRYALFDADGLPCAFTSSESALRFLLDWPSIPASRLLDLAFAAKRRDGPSPTTARGDGMHSPEHDQALGTADTAHAADMADKVGTRSPVIRWVDAEISPLDLLDELAPDSELRRQGKGYLGWCPFHDDRAPDGAGRPGKPSFYVVHDRRFGWSWRCLSTNCTQHAGPMRHSFRLLQELLTTDVRGAIRAAKARWPEADGEGAGEKAHMGASL